MSIYTGIILIRCLYANGKRRLMSYKEIATECFGAVGGWVTFFFTSWTTLGAPILYTVLAGSNLNELCKGTKGEIGNVPWGIVCCALVAVPFILVKSMKEVAWMSAMGALATVIVVFIVLVVACIDVRNIDAAHHDPVIWNKFPIALSTISFSFGGNAIYSHVEASMKTPAHWPRAVAGGLSTCAVLYFLSAVPGYYVYGDLAQSPIYSSISDGAPKIVAIAIMTFHVLTAAPLLVKEFLIRAVLRILAIVFVGVIGAVVPHFDDLMSLIGAFANCALVFIFPVVFYIRLTGFRNKPIYELVWCGFVVLLGIVGLMFGTIDAIQALISEF
ncbi:unnamed protein product [Rhizopus stolonifer]